MKYYREIWHCDRDMMGIIRKANKLVDDDNIYAVFQSKLSEFIKGDICSMSCVGHYMYRYINESFRRKGIKIRVAM